MYYDDDGYPPVTGLTTFLINMAGLHFAFGLVVSACAFSDAAGWLYECGGLCLFCALSSWFFMGGINYKVTGCMIAGVYMFVTLACHGAFGTIDTVRDDSVDSSFVMESNESFAVWRNR